MKVGPVEIQWRSRGVKIEKMPRMSEAELNRAFAQVDAKNPLLLALRQVLETAESEANEQAADQLRFDNALIMAGYTGSAKQCRELMAEIQDRREKGLKELRHQVPAAKN